MYKFIDLFAGIGGFRLGLEQAGCECVMSSEIDRNAQETYALNFGDYPLGDITKIPAESLPYFDILCAGFPCQSFSIGGLRKGFEDARGTLFFEVFIRTGVDLYVVRQVALLDVTYLAIAPVLDSTLSFASALGAPLDSTSRLFMAATSKNKEKFRETINLKMKADYIYILFLFVIGIPTALFYDKILKVENLDVWFYVFVGVGLIGKFLTYKVSVEGSVCTILKQDNYLAKVLLISESSRLFIFMLLVNTFGVYAIVLSRCLQLGIGYLILRPRVKNNINTLLYGEQEKRR